MTSARKAEDSSAVKRRSAARTSSELATRPEPRQRQGWIGAGGDRERGPAAGGCSSRKVTPAWTSRVVDEVVVVEGDDGRCLRGGRGR